MKVSSYEDPILQLIQENKGEPKLYRGLRLPKGFGQRGQMYAFITVIVAWGTGEGKTSQPRHSLKKYPSLVRGFATNISCGSNSLANRKACRVINGQRIGVWIPPTRRRSPCSPLVEPMW